MIADSMITAGWIIWPAVLIAAAAVDAVYSGMEAGVYALNKIRLDLRAESGDRAAMFLRRMLRNYNNLLTVLLIGTNLTRYVATFAIATMFVMAGFGDRAEWYTIAMATPVLFIVSDSVPKCVFRRLAEKLMYRLTWMLRISNALFLITGLSPLVRVVSALLVRLTGAPRAGRALGHEHLPAAIAEGQASGVLTHVQSVMASRVMGIADVCLQDVMVPMRQVVTVGPDGRREQLKELIASHDYSRVPVTGSDGAVVGVVNIYDAVIATDDVSVTERMTKPLVLPARTTVTDALYRMQRDRKTMAVVEGADGKHVGIITIKDLVEEIVGELQAW